MNLEGMNEAQRNAVLHGKGALLLLAGPGSGKTFTITNRILRLMEQGVSPETILVITFMKEAALSMQERFRSMSAKRCDPVNFGTFHSVFYHILRESQVLKSNDLLSNSEKKNLLFPILKNYEKNKPRQEGGLSSWEELGEEAQQILSAISFYKNTMNFSAAAARAPFRWQPDFEGICREYEKAVKRTGRLDFDDMLYACKGLLEQNSAVRDYWQKRFRHILIDEFQDINPVQYETIKLLTSPPYNLFAVGDDDQAIYGFRGSEPECLKRFVSEFHARQLLLDINYRSLPEIVDASLAVIGENKDRFVKKLKAAAGPTESGYAESSKGRKLLDIAGKRRPERENSAGKSETPVALLFFENSTEQYDHMLEELRTYCREAESCAVLFRTNSYMQGFAARLKTADIPYEMKEKAASIYEHFIVKDITAYLQVSCGQGTREQMLRIMNRPSRYISREAVGEGEVSIRKMMQYYRDAFLPQKQKTDVLDALARFERQLESICKLSLVPGINYILKAAGYERYLRDLSYGKPGKWEEWQELLEWLKEDGAKHRELKAWLAFQAEYREDLKKGAEKASLKKEDNSDSAGITDKHPIQLLTVHGAKGLEYDRVWIPDCNEGVFPHGRMPDEKSVEEERRIFYVAMTRAKKSLELLCITGTKERPRLPSRFLNPL